MNLTFRQLKTGAVGRSAGLDVTSCDFAQICNNAVEQLMTRGGWWSCLRVLDACVRDNVVTWPRGVGTIMALDVCNRTTKIQNKWYHFTPMERHHAEWGLNYQRLGWGGQLITETIGTSPVFNPIKVDGFKLRFFISNRSDAGKTITVYGTDTNGQTIRTQRGDGTWQDGVQLILAIPSVDTPMQVRHVERIVKDETNGYVQAYQYNVLQGFLLDLAQYQPSECNPEYITTRITGHRGGRNCGCLEQISALVKLNFIPFKYDDDLVQVDNQSAIRDMVLSIRKKEQGDIGAAAAYEASAIHELNLELRDKMPPNATPVMLRAFGTASGSRHLIGRYI